MSNLNGDGADGPRSTTDDPSTSGGDDATTRDGGDWQLRHARLESRRSRSRVRADEPADDWQARHSRTKRHT